MNCEIDNQHLDDAKRGGIWPLAHLQEYRSGSGYSFLVETSQGPDGRRASESSSGPTCRVMPHSSLERSLNPFVAFGVLELNS